MQQGPHQNPSCPAGCGSGLSDLRCATHYLRCANVKSPDYLKNEKNRSNSLTVFSPAEFASDSRTSKMLAPSASYLSASMAGTSSGGVGAALAGAAFSATALTPNPANTASASRLVSLSFMRHSIATHNEAAAAGADAMGSVYLSEAYADSR